MARLGGGWAGGAYAGSFYGDLDAGFAARIRRIGGRAAYIPKSNSN